MAVSSVTAPNSSSVKEVARDQVGFAGLNSEDFLKLLIAQLQNQDPTDPLDSDQLLRQISEMRNLQAGLELQSTLKNLSLTQQLASSTGFLGRQVTAVHGEQKTEIEGVVDRVQLRDGKALLRVNGVEVELTEVRSVAP
uniref:Basal-body rod modification protein FlgD n=1 Tax=Schlesneria paludicola TaxID=360056 RepID=A0A7C4QPM2_9PLAN